MKAIRNETLQRYFIQAWCLGCGRSHSDDVTSGNYVFFGYLHPSRISQDGFSVGVGKRQAISFVTLDDAMMALEKFNHDAWRGVVEVALVCACGCGCLLTIPPTGRKPRFFNNACRQRYFRKTHRG